MSGGRRPVVLVFWMLVGPPAATGGVGARCRDIRLAWRGWGKHVFATVMSGGSGVTESTVRIRARYGGLLTVALFAVQLSAPQANEPAISSELLLQTTRSWNGMLLSYPDGTAEITSMKITLEQGADTAFHCHPVPTLAFILSGVLEVRTASGGQRRFAKGESMAEVVNTWHRGRAVEGPVEIIVFYAGAQGVPNTIKPGSAEFAEQPCK